MGPAGQVLQALRCQQVGHSTTPGGPIAATHTTTYRCARGHLWQLQGSMGGATLYRVLAPGEGHPPGARTAASYRLWWRNNGTGPGLPGSQQFDSLLQVQQFLAALPPTCVLERLERNVAVKWAEPVEDLDAELAAEEARQ